MYAIILAGGKGERLGQHTQNLAKPMVEVGGKPLLEHQILQLKESGITDVVIAERYFAEDIKAYFGNGERFGVNVHHYQLGSKVRGTAGDLKEAMGQIPQSEQDVILMYGDILSSGSLKGLVEGHTHTRPLITILTVKREFPYGLIKKGKEGTIAGFEQKPTFLANGAIFALSREVTPHLPDEGDFSKDVLEKLAGKEHIGEYEFTGEWEHISTELDLMEARLRRGEGKITFESSASRGAIESSKEK